MKILGIDPGTAHTGFSVIQHTSEGYDLITYGLIRTSPKDGDVRNRIDYIGKCLEHIIAKFNPDVIALEDFTEQGKLVGKRYKEMAWITEHFRTLFTQLGYKTLVLKNGEWKKRTLGIMRANKKQVMHYVGRIIPKSKELLKNAKDHVWDSIGIAICASLMESTKKGEYSA